MKELATTYRENQLEIAQKWKALDWNTAPLAVRANLTEWIVEALQAEGRSEEEILAVGNSLAHNAALDIRANILKTKRDTLLEQLKRKNFRPKPRRIRHGASVWWASPTWRAIRCFWRAILRCRTKAASCWRF